MSLNVSDGVNAGDEDGSLENRAALHQQRTAPPTLMQRERAAGSDVCSALAPQHYLSSSIKTFPATFIETFASLPLFIHPPIMPYTRPAESSSSTHSNQRRHCREAYIAQITLECPLPLPATPLKIRMALRLWKRGAGNRKQPLLRLIHSEKAGQSTLNGLACGDVFCPAAFLSAPHWVLSEAKAADYCGTFLGHSFSSRSSTVRLLLHGWIRMQHVRPCFSSVCDCSFSSLCRSQLSPAL